MRDADAFSRRLIVVAVVATVIFICLTLGVYEGLTGAFDRSVVLGLRSPADASDPLGPAWLTTAIADITTLGQNTILTAVSWAAAGYLILKRRYLAAITVFIASSGATTIGNLVKDFVDRPRPDIVTHLVDVHTSSFPSGHATSATATYLTIALLFAYACKGRARAYVLGATAVLLALIGFSRVYLGVHYPADVFAGWALGVAWSALCVLVAEYWQFRFTGPLSR